MFLTESQKHYYTAMKKLGRKKPQKVIKRPRNQLLAMFYDLSNSRRFEIAIFVLIFLNMLTMGIEHYDQPHTIFFILEVSNAFFTTVFGLGKKPLFAMASNPFLNFCTNLCFFFRGDSKNSGSKIPLLYGSMERFRLSFSFSVNIGHTHGRHYDRFTHFAYVAPSG